MARVRETLDAPAPNLAAFRSIRQDQIDRRERDDGVTTDERAELCRENTRLRQKRDLLKRAAALFATESETR